VFLQLQINRYAFYQRFLIYSAHKGSRFFWDLLIEHGQKFTVSACIIESYQIGEVAAFASFEIRIIAFLSGQTWRCHGQKCKASFDKGKQHISLVFRQFFDPIEGCYDTQGVSERLWFVEVDACTKNYQFDDAVCFEKVTEADESADEVFVSLGVPWYDQIGETNVMVNKLLR
jgi:hypothetical protein